MHGLFKPKKQKEIIIPRNIISYDPFELLAKQNNQLLTELQNYKYLSPDDQKIFDDLYTQLQIATEEKIGNDHDFNVQFDNLEKYLQEYEKIQLQKQQEQELKKKLKNQKNNDDTQSQQQLKESSQNNNSNQSKVKLNPVQKYQLKRNIKDGKILKNIDCSPKKVRTVKIPFSQQQKQQQLNTKTQNQQLNQQQQNQQQYFQTHTNNFQGNKKLHIEKMAQTLQNMDNTIYNQGRKYFPKNILDYAQSYDKLRDKNYNLLFNNQHYQLQNTKSLSPKNSFHISVYSDNTYSSQDSEIYQENQFIYTNPSQENMNNQVKLPEKRKPTQHLTVAYTHANQQLKKIEKSNRRITQQFQNTLARNSIDLKLPDGGLLQSQNIFLQKQNISQKQLSSSPKIHNKVTNDPFKKFKFQGHLQDEKDKNNINRYNIHKFQQLPQINANFPKQYNHIIDNNNKCRSASPKINKNNLLIKVKYN